MITPAQLQHAEEQSADRPSVAGSPFDLERTHQSKRAQRGRNQPEAVLDGGRKRRPRSAVSGRRGTRKCVSLKRSTDTGEPSALHNARASAEREDHPHEQAHPTDTHARCCHTQIDPPRA
jgi:hypothetical protein